MTPSRTSQRFFLLLLAAASVLMALVVEPLATPLFLATVLAVVLWPVYGKLTAKLGRASVASAVVVLGVVLLLVAPLAGFTTFLVKEGADGFRFVANMAHSDGVNELVRKLPAPLEQLATETLAHLPAPTEATTPATTHEGATDTRTADGEKAVAAIGAVAKSTGSLLFQATMMVIALFFLLLHGDELIAWLDEVLPLPEGLTRELLAEFRSVSYAVVVSTVVTAAVQAVAALAGYLIANVPHPLFFAALTFFVAFIPAVGAASVCFVAAVILYVTGHPYMALFLAIWGLAVVGLVDNLIKPLIVKSGTSMSGAIAFFALIGGLGAFGTVGLLIGPLVVALFLALVRIYQRDFKPARSSTRA